jgi:hypothetical protein
VLRLRRSDVKSPRYDSKGRSAAMEFDMRAETQNLVEEIKQSVRLLRRHL